MQIGIEEAQSKLPQLIDFVKKGEEILLMEHGEVVAQIIAGAREQNRQKAKKIMQQFNKITKKHSLGSLDEILEWKEEGRR